MPPHPGSGRAPDNACLEKNRPGGRRVSRGIAKSRNKAAGAGLNPIRTVRESVAAYNVPATQPCIDDIGLS